MTSWKEFAGLAPELAKFGKTRFASEIAHLVHCAQMEAHGCIP